MDILSLHQSHVIYPHSSNILISHGEGMVNKIDHYKIHEVQKSELGCLSSWRVMLLFFPFRRNKSTHSVAPRLKKRANLHTFHKRENLII